MWGKIVLDKMHPISQILNYEKRTLQSRVKEHVYIYDPISVIDTPRLNEDDETKDGEVGSFLDKYISCSIPNEKANPKLNSLVKE